MPKTKIYPETYKLQVHKQNDPASNNSLTKVNNSFLHEKYYSTQANVGVCKECKNKGDNLVFPCNCIQDVYHPGCLKQILKHRIKEEQRLVQSEKEYKYIPCKQCGHKIKCKTFNRLKCKSCSQGCEQMGIKKCQCATFIILFLVFVGLLTYLIILGFDLIPNMQTIVGLQRSALLIACAVLCGFMLIFIIYCFLDCLSQSELKIDTLYDRREKSHQARSERSRYSERSRNSGKTRSRRESMMIEEIEGNYIS